MRAARDRPDIEFFALVGALEQQARNRVERALPRGLSSAGFSVLNHLALRGEDHPARLAATFRLTKGAITNTLSRLAAEGWISLADDPRDGRRKIAALTDAGRAAHAAAVAALRPQAEALRKAFAGDDFAGALPFLAALSAWLAEA